MSISEQILDAYAAENRPTLAALAARFGVTRNAVSGVIYNARQAKDLRAGVSSCKARSKNESRDDAILDAWADPSAPTAAMLARRFSVSKMVIWKVLRLARAAWDARATRMPQPALVDKKRRVEAILDAYADPAREPMKEIGCRYGVSESFVDVVVRQARRSGDPRAALRNQRRSDRKAEAA